MLYRLSRFLRDHYVIWQNLLTWGGKKKEKPGNGQQFSNTIKSLPHFSVSPLSSSFKFQLTPQALLSLCLLGAEFTRSSMARNKEKLVLLLDVGPSMHSVLPEVEKVCSMLVEKKLIFRKNDEVGVVVFGTEETNNDLTKEVGGYDHIVVLEDIKVVDGDLIDTLQKLPRGTVDGDFLDAIVVGMDMLIKKYKDIHKGKKRLCLITNAVHPIKDSLEGTKEDQVETIAAQMTAQGMKMESVVVRGRLSQDANKRIMDENDRLLSIFSKQTLTRTVYVDSPTSLLGALKTRRITPVTVFRGDLELSPDMKIKVWVYKRTQEEKFPTLKKYSEKAPQTNKFATHQVKVDYEYKTVDGASKVVPPEQRIKGYRYGPQVVPISAAEWDAVKFKPEKGVKLLGFTDASNIMRHYYMKDVYLFIAEPGNTRAILSVSAIARAMKEMNKVAILRCVWRQGQQNVVLGVLTPNISQNDKLPDSFYFNVLPFIEDVREYQFPSFNSFPVSWQPNEQQQKAADELVQMLNLAPSGKEEALLPDYTPNPVLERFYRHLELKSKQPDAAVPPLDGTLKRITEPDPELFFENKSVIDALRKHFELKENPKLKKSARRLLREKPSGSNDEDGDADVSDAQAVNSIEKALVVKIEKIGDLTPVQDFEVILSRRDSPEWVGKAIKEMRDKILGLLSDSHEGDNHLIAVECIAALRKGCILEQEPEPYNNFLRYLNLYCQQKGMSNFWQLLASRKLTLVSKSEAADSDVTDNEARRFFVKTEPKPKD
ncbi:Ku80 family protein isoform 1 [Theobroma cacao]|uniref:Ku80 family protein isoform 1 n=1 Tax=Theobroma cacao TaxID=3641 RepID=A0A061DVZ1_THECC|nr:Ku80 family protein isoform 1 [Theobroma cacao]